MSRKTFYLYEKEYLYYVLIQSHWVQFWINGFANNCHYLNYFGRNKGAVDLFYSYFIVSQILVYLKNIFKYNDGSALRF